MTKAKTIKSESLTPAQAASLMSHRDGDRRLLADKKWLAFDLTREPRIQKRLADTLARLDNATILPGKPVKLTDLDTGESYIATDLDECRDQTDREIFGLVQTHGVISMGKIVGEPVGK
jgi:hypothetical protein